MSHEDEYTESMLAAMDLIWGEGFMAPGGEGNVDQLLRGLDVRDLDLLDIGCGQGKSACLMAAKWGARVTGTDLEAHLIARASARAERERLSQIAQFMHVSPGPLDFKDASFDVITISGALTQVADKAAMFSECLRVLRPGGVLSCYDWMTPDGSVTDEMKYWFKLEGLTYELRTPEAHLEAMASTGFVDCQSRDKSAWYRRESAREYARLRGPLREQLRDLLGDEGAAHFIEDWRVLVKLCDTGQLLQVYTRGKKPDR